MSATIPLSEQRRWLELRDDRNKLCARLEARSMLLEIRRNDRTSIFDLRDYLELAELNAVFELLKE